MFRKWWRDYVQQCLIFPSSDLVKNCVTLQRAVYDSLGPYLLMFHRLSSVTMPQALHHQCIASIITQIKTVAQSDIIFGLRCWTVKPMQFYSKALWQLNCDIWLWWYRRPSANLQVASDMLQTLRFPLLFRIICAGTMLHNVLRMM